MIAPIPTPDPASDTAPDPAPTSAPTVTPEQIVSGADNVRADIAAKNETIGDILNRMDSWAVAVGNWRISAFDVLFAVMAVLLLVGFAWAATRLTRSALRHLTALDSTQRVLTEKIATIIIWVVTFFMGVDLLGIDLTALTVFSGAFGLAIGFGLQKTFGNLISGIILLMDKSIKPGDVIAVADQSGNHTFGQIRRIGIQVNVGVSYDADMELAEKLMLEAAAKARRVLKTPPPTVWMSEYGDSSVNFTIHCWITDPEDGVGNVRSEVLKNLWWLFKEHGIEIPFPQRDINLRDNAQVKALIAALTQRSDDAERDGQ